MLLVLTVLAALVPALSATPSSENGFLRPEKAGFRHAALVYGDMETPAEDADDGEGKTLPGLQHLVALHKGSRPVRDGWLFDAFVMLRFTAASGQSTDYGATTAEDWRTLLDSWFGSPQTGSGGIGQLDEAVVKTAATLADDDRPMGVPPSRRKVIVSVPWPSTAQRSFGAVDGAPVDFAKTEDRTRAVAWYTRMVQERFNHAKYRHLDLWGIYFMREDATGTDPQWLPSATAAVHAQGLKALWIPYADAPGAEQAEGFGFDATILQPSYAFTSPYDGGQVSASRLRSTAKRAARHGLGVEMEVRHGGADGTSRRVLRQYLAEGIRLGYRDSASAWFLGLDPNLWVRNTSAYADIADYLLGRTIDDDDVHPRWDWSNGVAEASFPARDDLRSLRVDLGESAVGWSGTVRVEARTPRGWQSAGWAVARPPEHIDSAAPTLTVPLAKAHEVGKLRVSFSPRVPQVVRLTPDTVWTLPPPAPANSRALAPYPDLPAAAPGTWAAGKLTDGQWASGGWQPENAVGWPGWFTTTNITVDLGQARALSRVLLRTHGGGSAGVHWPKRPTLMLSDCPLAAYAGTGPMPCAATVLRADVLSPEVTGGSGADLSGIITFRANNVPAARYLTVALGSHGWLMLDEIEAYDGRGVGSRNVALQSPYQLDPPPGS